MHLFGDPEFWIAVAAAVFIVVVWRPARRALLGSLDDRAARIRDDLAEARRLRDEAELLLTGYRQKEREAANEAQSIIAQARGEAERVAAEAARDLELMLARRQRLAEERIAQAEAKAVDEIRAVAVDVAIAAAHAVIAAEINGERGGALIDSAIAALPQRMR